MEFGIFCAPYAPAYVDGEQSAGEVIAWDLQITKWADQFGLSEAYYAEHYTVGDQPSPAPDLMIAAASQVTDNIRLGAAAHLLPYHNPVALAYRMMWLDHMTGGRYIAGMAPGTFPTDAQLFGTGKNNNEMLDEALDIIEMALTKQGPHEFKGKFWTLDIPEFSESVNGPHLKPLQTPMPPMIMTGMQANSPTLRLAASRGYAPMSQQVSAESLRDHWRTFEEAATAAGHSPHRRDWRVMRDFFVADTDEQAREAVLTGGAGTTWERTLLPAFRRLNLLPAVVGPDIDPDEVTLEWLADNFWLVGSPETVTEKIRKLDEDCGGIGKILSFTYDFRANAEAYRRSFELLGTKVAPNFA